MAREPYLCESMPPKVSNSMPPICYRQLGKDEDQEKKKKLTGSREAIRMTRGLTGGDYMRVYGHF